MHIALILFGIETLINAPMKTFHSFLLFLALSMLFFVGCSKDDNTNLSTSGQNQLEEDNLCFGDGGDSYFPLAVDNYWNYQNADSIGMEITIIESIVLNNDIYFIVEYADTLDTGIVNRSQDTFRQTDVGDIYRRIDGGLEYLYIPADPQVADEWEYPLSSAGVETGTRKVQSLSYAFSTTDCDYNNCLVIRLENNAGELIGLDIYGKGIGLVNLDLKEVVLN